MSDAPATPVRERLVVAISSRALFDLDASNDVFVERGVEAYRQYQIDHEDEPLAPGEAFDDAVGLPSATRRVDEKSRQSASKRLPDAKASRRALFLVCRLFSSMTTLS